MLLWRAFRGGDARWSWVLPAGLVVTGVWAIVLLRRATGWNTWLWPAVGVVMALAVIGLFVFRTAGSGTRARLLAVSVAAAVVAGLAGPTAYAASPAFASATGGMGGTNPTAGPSTGNGMGGPGGRGGFGGDGGGPGGQQNGTQQGGQAGGELPGGGNGQMQPGGGDGELPQGGGAPSGGTNGEFPGGGTAPGGNGGTGGAPSGGFGGGGGMGGSVDSELIAYLEKHQDGAKWLLAVSNSQSAGQLILSTHQPVISMWGFTGSDQAMTLAKLKELVKKGELHYIQLGGGGMGGNSSLNQEITSWVQKNGTAVKASEYSSSSTSDSGSSSSSDSSSSSGSSSSSIYRLDASDVS